MKYETGMLRFNSIIFDNVWHMCGSDPEIIKHKDEGNAALLREYLKKTYNNRGCAISSRIKYSLFGKGMTITAAALEEFCESELELSWSQLATFIRRLMMKGEWKAPEPDQADEKPAGSGKDLTYIELLLSDEGYKDLTPEQIIYQEDYCPYDLFVGKEDLPEIDEDNCIGRINDTQPYRRDCNKCRECWNSKANGAVVWEYADSAKDIIESYESYLKINPEKVDEIIEFRKNSPEIHASEQTEAEQLPEIPAESDISAFDYSGIDCDTADKLRSFERDIRKETANYFTSLGSKFKEAQALLASHSAGTFEKWYTSMGFKRQTVYNLIQRYEFITSPAIGEHAEAFENLPLTLSYSASAPDAPKELVEKVLEGDITTNKDYIELKKQLEEQTKRAEEAEARSETSHKEFLQMADYRTALAVKNHHLEEKIKELESRPVDVAVQPDTEALAEKDEEIKKLKEMQSEYIDEVNELEDRIEELQGRTPTDDVINEMLEVLKERVSAALTELVNFMQEYNVPKNRRQDCLYKIEDSIKAIENII